MDALVFAAQRDDDLIVVVCRLLNRMARVDGDLQLVFAPFDPGDIYPLTVKPIGIPEGRGE